MLSELGKEKTHYHKRRGLNENVMSRVPYRRLKYYIVDKDFQTTKWLWGSTKRVRAMNNVPFKPPQKLTDSLIG